MKGTFELTDRPIDPAKWNSIAPDCGAAVHFFGLVRNHHEGRGVERLEYSAYETLALKEGAKIVAEIQERFGIGELICVHRLGNLTIADVAVWIRASSAHRGEAFEACEAAIDEIKRRVPIWKKEFYTDGTTEWVLCNHKVDERHA